MFEFWSLKMFLICSYLLSILNLVTLEKLLLKSILRLYVLIMSGTGFRVNPHSILTWISSNSLLKTGPKSEVLNDRNETQTHNHLACKYLSIQCIWLYVIIMPCTRFRVNPHSIVTWMSRNSLVETGVSVVTN